MVRHVEKSTNQKHNKTLNCQNKDLKGKSDLMWHRNKRPGGQKEKKYKSREYGPDIKHLPFIQ